MTQADYIEQCIFFLVEDDEYISTYRQASPQEKANALSMLKAHPGTKSSPAGPANDQRRKALLTEFMTRPMAPEAFNPATMRQYLLFRNQTVLFEEREKLRCQIWDDARPEPIDSESEEWKIFCDLKRNIAIDYGSSLITHRALLEEHEHILGKFLIISDGADDVYKPSIAHVVYDKDSIYVHFVGLPEGQGPVRRMVELVKSQEWTAYKDMISDESLFGSLGSEEGL